MEASFPVAGPVDERLHAARAYLMSVSRDFRLALLQETKPKKGKKGKAAAPADPPAKPDTCDIFVATAYPAWQQRVLAILQAAYDAPTRAFTLSDDALAQAIRADDALRRDLKRVMPFFANMKRHVLAHGADAFHRQLAFDEAAVLADNMAYLCHQLDVMTIRVREVADGEGVTKVSVRKALDAAEPGRPASHFYASG